MAKVLVDTTYLLPLAGIDLESMPRDAIRQVQALNHDLYVSTISIFELLAKAGKLAVLGKAEDERILSAVQALVKSPDITLVGTYDMDAARIALKIRHHHSDFIDCLILATALAKAEVLLTENLLLLEPNENLKGIILRENRLFKAVPFKSLRKG